MVRVEPRRYPRPQLVGHPVAGRLGHLVAGLVHLAVHLEWEATAGGRTFLAAIKTVEEKLEEKLVAVRGTKSNLTLAAPNDVVQ
ncbi:MAG: hypothetical protein DSY43_04110 [Gammaproteobacteria bacterium]|nr:MAG: hypothetical protein DSY43_04110 [Gammaproteobacteria bacterium]